MKEYSHPRCYARSLLNCSKTIMKEHYISSSVLSLIGTELEISGTPWLKGQIKKLTINNITSNILCGNHNSQLHRLDDYAFDFFSLLKKSTTMANTTNNIAHERTIISGKKIESWFIKLYLGAHWSGQFGKDGAPLKTKLDPEKYLLDNVFNDIPLPHDFGLYLVNLPIIKTFNGISITSYVCPIANSKILAITCSLLGLPFTISLREAIHNGTGKIDHGQRHPRGITFENGQTKSELIFDWT